MRAWMAVCLLFAGLGGGRSIAAQVPDVQYVNGTVKGLAEVATGILDTTSERTVDFRAGSVQFSIPYAEILNVKCREENRFRLGVLATVGVGLLKARSKRHLVTVEWVPADGPPEVATFDAPKDKARGLALVLRARAPHACASAGQSCAFAD
jgi:hypothetical protein